MKLFGKFLFKRGLSLEFNVGYDPAARLQPATRVCEGELKLGLRDDAKPTDFTPFAVKLKK